MLTRNITYTDFDGNEVTEKFYFNLTRAELVAMELNADGGMASLIQKMIDTKDLKSIEQQFKHLILMSYGKKSDDGKRFIKTDELREEFTQTAAYDELYIELLSDIDAAVAFFQGIMPFEIPMAEVETVKAQLLANDESEKVLPKPPAPPAPTI